LLKYSPAQRNSQFPEGKSLVFINCENGRHYYYHYYYGDKIKGWAGHVARMGAMRNAYKILVGVPKRKGPLGGHRRRCKDNIRLDFRVESCGLDVSGSRRDRWRAVV